MQFQEFFNHQLGITSSLNWKKRNSQKLFAAKQLCQIPIILRNKKPVSCIALEKQEYRYLLSGSGGGHIAIHDRSLLSGRKTFSTVAEISRKKTGKASIGQLQWYPHDTGMFFMLNYRNHVTVWDTNQLQVVEYFKLSTKICDIHTREIGRNPLIAACSKDHNIYLCDLSTGSRSHTLKGHVSPVITVKWSPKKEEILYSASANGLINVWDVRKPKSLLETLHHSPQVSKKHKQVNSICFTPGGQSLLSLAADGTLKQWSTEKHQIEVDYNQVSSEDEVISDRPCNMEVSSTHCKIFLPNLNKVKALEMHTGKHVRAFNGHFKHVSGLCYNDPFQELITCSYDASILVWENRKFKKEETVEDFHQDGWSDVSD